MTVVIYRISMMHVEAYIEIFSREQKFTPIANNVLFIAKLENTANPSKASKRISE